ASIFTYVVVLRRWGLIAGRVPGRKAEEIERFWIMSHGESFAEKRLEREAGRVDCHSVHRDVCRGAAAKNENHLLHDG
ncbi:hypothetical protein GW17_00060454, partial [Ensete ventricosum]